MFEGLDGFDLVEAAARCQILGDEFVDRLGGRGTGSQEEEERAEAVHATTGLPREQVVVQIDQPGHEPNPARYGFAEIDARVRIEESLLCCVAALQPDVDGLIRVP